MWEITLGQDRGGSSGLLIKYQYRFYELYEKIIKARADVAAIL
jgi:hypothetical protein